MQYEWEWDVWVCEFQIWAARVALEQPDPDEVVTAFLEDAEEGDEARYRFAAGMWHTIRTMNSFELERLISLRRAERQQLDRTT